MVWYYARSQYDNENSIERPSVEFFEEYAIINRD